MVVTENIYYDEMPPFTHENWTYNGRLNPGVGKWSKRWVYSFDNKFGKHFFVFKKSGDGNEKGFVTDDKLKKYGAKTLEEMTYNEYIDSNQINNVVSGSLSIINNETYYVMKYFPQGTLQDLIDSQTTTNKLSLDEKITYFSQISNGLSEIHKKLSINHFDLKPENILIEDNWAGISDFPTATSFDNSKLEKYGFFGDPKYLSPLHFLGRKGPSNDVYALANIGLELFIGERLNAKRIDSLNYAKVIDFQKLQYELTENGDLIPTKEYKKEINTQIKKLKKNAVPIYIRDVIKNGLLENYENGIKFNMNLDPKKRLKKTRKVLKVVSDSILFASLISVPLFYEVNIGQGMKKLNEISKIVYNSTYSKETVNYSNSKEIKINSNKSDLRIYPMPNEQIETINNNLIFK